MRINYYCFPEETDKSIKDSYGAEDNRIAGIRVNVAKKLLKEFGGHAWTCHIDRYGCCFETSEIELKSNNSKFKYDRHL